MKEITSPQNSLVKHLVKLRQNRDYREEHQTVLIEGLKLVHEISPLIPVQKILTVDLSLLPKNLSCNESFLVTPEIMQKITEMQSPEGLIAEVEMPKPCTLQNKRYLLALDRVNDPGNLGTLLRTALALGWEGVFILPNCCDPFNDKALRAAKGATFRLPFRQGNWKELQSLISENQLIPIAADIEGVSLNEFKAADRLLLVLGNEARGLSLEAKKLCQKITIPMCGDMESLNVSIAGGILMYALKTHQKR